LRALRDAVRATVNDHPGGLEAVAEMLHREPKTIDSAISNLAVSDLPPDPDDPAALARTPPRVRLHAHQLVEIMIRCGPDRIFRVIGPEMRRTLIPLPKPATELGRQSYGERLNAVHDRVSAVSIAVSAALSPDGGGWSQLAEAEERDICDVLYEAYVLLAMLRTDVEARARADNVTPLRPVPGGKGH
jgi:hypothetical protein